MHVNRSGVATMLKTTHDDERRGSSAGSGGGVFITESGPGLVETGIRALFGLDPADFSTPDLQAPAAALAPRVTPR